MSITRNRMRTVYWLPLIGLYLSLALLLLSSQAQEAYAERKKVSGTHKVITQLAIVDVACFGPGVGIPLWVWHSMLNSDDPDWNNVQRFYFQYDDVRKERHFRGYGVNTHPNLDQTFFQFKGTSEPIGSGPYDYSWKIEGFFLKGTGKFEGIVGSIVASGITSMAEKTWDWEVQYEIR